MDAEIPTFIRHTQAQRVRAMKPAKPRRIIVQDATHMAPPEIDPAQIPVFTGRLSSKARAMIRKEKEKYRLLRRRTLEISTDFKAARRHELDQAKLLSNARLAEKFETTVEKVSRPKKRRTLPPDDARLITEAIEVREEHKRKAAEISAQMHRELTKVREQMAHYTCEAIGNRYGVSHWTVQAVV